MKQVLGEYKQHFYEGPVLIQHRISVSPGIGMQTEILKIEVSIETLNLEFVPDIR